LIDLNHLLLFIALVSPIVLLARLSGRHGARHAGWATAAIIVLVGTGFSWLLVPGVAGLIGGTLWALFLLVPSILDRKTHSLFLQRRFSEARRLALVRRTLHPWDDSPYRPSLLRCLELARDGRMDAALDQLARERAAPTTAGRFASALTFALTENWPGLLEWHRRQVSVTAEPAVVALYLRALGETGALDDLVREFASHSDNREMRLTSDSNFASNLAMVLAFCGRSTELVRLVAEQRTKLSHNLEQFWLATAELAEDHKDAACQRLAQLRAQTRDAILQRSIERRLRQPQDFSPTPLSRSSRILLARLLPATVAQTSTQRSSRGAPAVWALILLNVAMFGVELMFGGATNSVTLHYLGALEPDAVIVRHEYWRLLTALFLHYGALHIAFNLYALYLLGPALESIIGSLKFTVSYLVSGLGSSAGVVLLRAIGLTDADQLVGASGCVMGVIGVSAGLLLRHRQSPLAGRRLRNIIVIVVLQTAFDLSTPQVSLAAHLSGFVTGLGVGTILASKPRLTIQ
jgi:rhomboid protease GluP